ncbi:uncharacterized protein F5891DRAFT_980626 [Suillus fuscotomentosus]|uniref:Uncharacterized protein n=1 Tax=Suillus fuscotomentosus TaxID=1912939 RepID=A0AAD4E5B7_9AGAM|nr:uncharacterized protein F5891DRAFT_980626 [Suillus fuscotomentosus]KAG1900010.1 hypothetical protein F5891DRAFT_980626 [Suillus fuscotomentosus]
MSRTSNNSSWNDSPSTGHCSTKGKRPGGHYNDPLPHFTLWDASKVFKFATSRFMAIRHAVGKSYVQRTPNVYQLLGKHIMWEAQTAEVQLNFTEVMDIVSKHFQQWVRFQLFCNVSANIGQPEGALLAALPTTMNPQGGPLSKQLLAVRAAAARATDEVRRMIEDKQIEAVIGAESLGHLEEINIGHAMEASRRVVHCVRQMVTTP